MKATIPLPSHRDGYRGTDTFPAQNRECRPCARPAPCTQPFLPCSTSMVSMSQGHWMREPRSEYAHVWRGPACSHTELRSTRAFTSIVWRHINAKALLIHFKCWRDCFNYLNELVKDRNSHVHTHTHTPPLLRQLLGEGFNTSPSSHFAWWCSDITLRWELMFCLCIVCVLSLWKTDVGWMRKDHTFNFLSPIDSISYTCIYDYSLQ